MVKSDLLPTTENLMNTFCDNAIDRNADIADFVRLINSISTPFSIALDGAWGSGKTFFVKQTKMVFDSYNKFTQVEHNLNDEQKIKIQTSFEKLVSNDFEVNNFVSVYFDAWEYDTDEDPIQSLIYQISKDVSSAYKFSKEYDFLGIASAIIDNLSGRDTKSLIEKLKGKNIIDGTAANKSIQELVNEYLQSLIPECGNRLLIFIDELDRCNPQYAVRLLERIKHYFTNENITFVFSVNKDQLQHTIKQHYGNDFAAYNYLDRFFDLTVSIPKCNLKKHIDSFSGKIPRGVYLISSYLSQRFDMSLREISHFFDALGVITNNRTNIGGRSHSFCLFYVLPIALALKFTNDALYKSFMNGQESKLFADVLCGDENIELDLCEFHLAYDIDVKAELTKVYNAIFNDTPNTKNIITIQRLRIGNDEKEFLEKNLSMLCRDASY